MSNQFNPQSVGAKTTELLVNMTCGKCGKYSLALPVSVLHDRDDFDAVTADCPDCGAENDLEC